MEKNEQFRKQLQNSNMAEKILVFRLIFIRDHI